MEDRMRSLLLFVGMGTALIAAGGGVILRIDQRKGETVAFFAGGGEAAKGVKSAGARFGELEVKTSSSEELAKLP